MVKKIFQIVGLMSAYAKRETFAKLIYCVVYAVTTPMILYAVRRLIDHIAVCLTGDENQWGQVYLWLGILIVSMIFSTCLPAVDTMLDIRFQMKLNERFSTELLGKFGKVEYKFYEDSKYHDILKRMGDRPQEKLLKLFQDIIHVFTVCVTIVSLYGA